MDSAQAIKTAMNINFSVFREPRGVMRILQFIFSICAFATTTGYTNTVKLTIKCNTTDDASLNLTFSYPYRLYFVEEKPEDTCHHEGLPIQLNGDFSSDAQFFVATGVLSFLYCIGIAVVYIMFDNMYQSNGLLPLADFILTVTLAVFWLSGSAAWANGLNGLKRATHPDILVEKLPTCKMICKSATIGNFSGLNISVILGFLNFFLWASDLWFLYKETPWFKLKQGTSGVNTAA